MVQSKASRLEFVIANRSFTYDFASGSLLKSTLKPINGKVKIRLLSDWDVLEMFGNDGQVSYAENFKFTPGDGFISLKADGKLKITSARFSPINRCWAGPGNNTFIDDSDSRTVYSANWRSSSNEKPYLNGTLHLSNTAGATIQYTFKGTQIAWYGLKNNDLGMAAIYIDGVLQADNIDCYSTERMVQQLFKISGLSEGDHTIKLEVRGTRNPSSANNYIVHDYFGTADKLFSSEKKQTN